MKIRDADLSEGWREGRGDGAQFALSKFRDIAEWGGSPCVRYYSI